MKFTDLEILREDDDVVYINKPAGLLTIPDRYDAEEESLSKILETRYGKIFIVHRLDKFTSGVIVFAKNAEAHKFLNKQFSNREAERIYHIIVSGVIIDESLEIDIPLMPNPGRQGGVIPSARGKESITLIKVIKRYSVATLLKCKLVTGRQHQIRAHMAAIGHPLLVDEFYGTKSAFYLSEIKRRYNLKKNTTENPVISRITMHSKSLGLQHPASGDLITIEAEEPKDFSVLIKLLDKYASH